MGIREDVLALADDVESTIGGCYGCLLDKRGLCKADSDFDCGDEVCKFVAHRLRAIVVRDAKDDTTVNAYDLLPDDDRKAISWVREHGGIERCEAFVHQAAMEHGYLLKIAHALGTSIYDGSDNADALLEKLEKRLMPEGMEWPVFEDGEPVRIGDVAVLADNEPHEVESMEFFADKSCKLKGKGTPWMNTIFKGQVAKRPAPKVLDADGAEIRVGDKLYDTDTGCARIVRAINAIGTVEFEGHEDSGWFTEFLTHRAPVLAADGEPLEAGQTVYAKNYGYVKCTVLAIEWVVDGYLVEVENEGGHKFRQTPDEFTHQRPVLDADGNRIEPSMDVWWVCEGDERGIHSEKLHVDGIDKDGMVERSPYNGGTSVALEPSELYVHKPALDADGVPIKKGDTVYVLGFGEPLTVKGFTDEGRVLMSFHDENSLGYKPSKLTHEQPDTWERIEEDANLAPGDYIEKCGRKTDLYAYQEMPIDLVRRCRALAERGA